MRTSYKARQQRQYHERNDKANLQLFVCAHDIGQAGLQLGYRRMLGYLDRTPMSHLVRICLLNQSVVRHLDTSSFRPALRMEVYPPIEKPNGRACRSSKTAPND